ncbi:MAG TPA: metal-dependent hydrolase [Planctomycetota bacterium]|nr:metal-dependent hydrolase [Planctomycetota bacterium]
MDNLAHTLVGIGVSRAGLARRFGSGTTLTLAVASNAPDIDALVHVWDPFDMFLLRRTHTHALVVVPLLAVATALALRPWCRGLPSKTHVGLAALGIGLHLFLDLVNAFGVVLLWPFSWRRFELACVFVIDPVVWLLMLAPALAGKWMKTDDRRLRLWQGAVALLGAYLLLCQTAHWRAAAAVPADGREVRLFPEPLGPHRFRAAVRGEGAWEVYHIRVLPGRAERAAVVPTRVEAPRVRELRASPWGLRLEAFMAAPVWTLRDDGTVEVRDLRFESLVVPRRNPLVAVFPPGSSSPFRR